MKKKTALLLGIICAFCITASMFAGCGAKPVHEHRIYHYDEYISCVEEGHKAYDECLYCNKKYIDGVEVADSDVILPLMHDIIHYEAAEATCYAAKHTAHNVCRACHQIVESAAGDSAVKKYENVYTGSRAAHNFNASGVCSNAGCNARRKEHEIVKDANIPIASDAAAATRNIFENVGNLTVYIGGSSTISAPENGKYEFSTPSNASSIRFLEMCLLPTEPESKKQFVGVYSISFDLKYTNKSNATDPDGFSFMTNLVSGLEDGSTYYVKNDRIWKKLTVGETYHFEVLVETVSEGQVFLFQFGNKNRQKDPSGTKTDKKFFEITNFDYVFYADSAKANVNRIEMKMPDIPDYPM